MQKNQIRAHQQALLTEMKALIQQERNHTLTVIKHLDQIDQTKAFALLGYSSLFNYCINELAYSESAAYRRIEAMRALRQTPSIVKSIEDGALNLSSVGLVRNVLKKKKAKGEKPTEVEVIELFQSVMHKTTREAQKEFAKKYPEEMTQMKDRFNPSNRELRITLSEEAIQLLTEVRNLAAHRMKDQGAWSELIALSAKLALKQIRKERKKEIEQNQSLEAIKEDSSQNTMQQTETLAELPLDRTNLSAPVLMLEKKSKLKSPVNPHNPRVVPHPLQREVWKNKKAGKSNAFMSAV